MSLHCPFDKDSCNCCLFVKCSRSVDNVTYALRHHRAALRCASSSGYSRKRSMKSNIYPCERCDCPQALLLIPWVLLLHSVMYLLQWEPVQSCYTEGNHLFKGIKWACIGRESQKHTVLLWRIWEWLRRMVPMVKPWLWHWLSSTVNLDVTF